MIDQEPLKRGANDGRRPDKPVRRNLGAGCSHVPVVAGLPAALERRIVGVEKPTYGRCRMNVHRHSGFACQARESLRHLGQQEHPARAAQRPFWPPRSHNEPVGPASDVAKLCSRGLPDPQLLGSYWELWTVSSGPAAVWARRGGDLTCIGASCHISCTQHLCNY